MNQGRFPRFLGQVVIMASIAIAASTASAADGSYQDLLKLFSDWRTFEHPPLREGAPDYTAATFARRHTELKQYVARLDAIKPDGWPIEQRVDYQLVRAEMNGFDFYVRVLKPWERDPAFYTTVWTDQSDTPAHEGTIHHDVAELWTYKYPLDAASQKKLAGELRAVPPLLKQAQTNLTANTRDLFSAAIITMKGQSEALTDLDKKVAGTGAELKRAIADAQKATQAYVAWLEKVAPTKTGPSGIGKENYTWSLQKVHMLPLTWDDEVMILKRELARTHASLKLEEQRNRKLPQLKAAQNEEEFQKLADKSIRKYMAFLKDTDAMTVKANMEPALRAKAGNFVPEETRNFFYIATHYEPLTLYTHFYHWWDLAQIRDEPHASPIRRGAMLYNIWDSRAEGMATAMEEFMLHAGLFDDNPRAREIVWIMLAQRAARGLASLYAQSNEFTMKEAMDFQVRWTPRDWMSPHLGLLGFEQSLYLRQPGYGTSYVVGKHLLEDLMKDRAKQLGDKFTLRGYFDEVNAAGMIPVPLIRWQLTGVEPGRILQ